MKYRLNIVFRKGLKIRLVLLMFIFQFVISSLTVAQDPINIKDMSRADIMNLTYEQLLEMQMEDLLYLAQKMDISVDDLLTMKLSVSSKNSTSLREQPGIITIYTSEDLDKLGLRDFTDLLRLVQGFNINFDSQGVLGVSMRGIWSFEGKMLFLVDGIEMNDLLYSSMGVGNRFPLDQIKRVEIIRGPGSSIYGGSAEMGVVNIITKSGEDLNGAGITGIGGYMTEQPGHYGGGIQVGNKWKNLDVSILANHNESNRSESFYQDFYGFEGYLKDTLAHLVNDNVNVGIKFKELTARMLYDDYHTYAIYGAENSFAESFTMFSGDIKYDYKPTAKLCISPRVNVINSVPWDNGDGEAHINDRYLFNLTSMYDINKNINLVAGGEYFNDVSSFQDGSYFYTGEDKLIYSNTAVFGQGLFKTKFINAVLGARYEMHSFYGNAFAPRIGFNKIYGNFHFKILYSKAFRSPSSGNITTCDTLKRYNKDIKPEKTDVAELEIGYKIGKNNYITLNFFDISIKEPIVWYDEYEDSLFLNNMWYYNYNRWGYRNMGKTGSRGFDLDVQSKYRWGSTNIGYSFYTAKGKNDIEAFAIEDNEHMLIGNPQHKLTLAGNYNITPKISISPSIIWMSATNAYTELDSLGESVLNEIDPCLLLNLMFRFSNFPVRNMNIDFGVYDILDNRYPYTEPYNGYYPPFPGPSREIVLKIKYMFKFKE
jgi:outer membrane receptor for ferrienterochelin and colicin